MGFVCFRLPFVRSKVNVEEERVVWWMGEIDGEVGMRVFFLFKFESDGPMRDGLDFVGAIVSRGSDVRVHAEGSLFFFLFLFLSELCLIV